MTSIIQCAFCGSDVVSHHKGRQPRKKYCNDTCGTTKHRLANQIGGMILDSVLPKVRAALNKSRHS